MISYLISQCQYVTHYLYLKKCISNGDKNKLKPNIEIFRFISYNFFHFN